MKNSFKILMLSLVFGFSVLSCTSSKKMLEKGNYYEAVLYSVEKLKKNPNNTKAQETLQEAYYLAKDDLLDKLNRDKLTQPQFANSATVYTYQDLNRMYEKIQQSPIAKQIIKNPENFYKQLSELKPLAAEEQYQAGANQLAIGTRENSKQAYYYFQEADNFVNDYKDVSEKMDQAYHMALLHVVTDFKSVNSRMYKLSANTFYKELENSLNQLEQGRFIRFHSINDAKKENIKNPDHYIRISFEDFVVGETHTKERIEKMEKDSVKVGDVKLDSGRKKAVYGTVNAEVSINRMEIISRGLVNVSITENTNSKEVLLNENIPGEFVWFNEWGVYNGDKRALTKNQVQICNNKNIPPPPPQQMFVEFTKPIHNDIKSRLINFYRNY